MNNNDFAVLQQAAIKGQIKTFLTIARAQDFTAMEPSELRNMWMFFSEMLLAAGKKTRTVDSAFPRHSTAVADLFCSIPIIEYESLPLYAMKSLQYFAQGLKTIPNDAQLQRVCAHVKERISSQPLYNVNRLMHRDLAWLFANARQEPLFSVVERYVSAVEEKDVLNNHILNTYLITKETPQQLFRIYPAIWKSKIGKIYPSRCATRWRHAARRSNSSGCWRTLIHHHRLRRQGKCNEHTH